MARKNARLARGPVTEKKDHEAHDGPTELLQQSEVIQVKSLKNLKSEESSK